MITVYPIELTGIKHITDFSVSADLSENFVISWGDGNYSYDTNETHIYESGGVFSLTVGNCAETSSFQISCVNGPFYNNRVSITSDTVSTAGCPIIINYEISSNDPSATLEWYSKDSISRKEENDSFWSHLNPYWKFENTDLSFTEITSIYGTLGYCASGEVVYFDSMIGNPTVFATLKTSDTTNERTYSSASIQLTAAVPSEIKITHDGIDNIGALQFADTSIPVVYSIVSNDPCGSIMNYVTGSIIEYKIIQGCNFIDEDSITVLTGTVSAEDEDCFVTGGYLKTTFSIPSSAISSITYNNEESSCGSAPLDTYEEKINYPKQLQISAFGIFGYDGTNYELTGISAPFDVYKIESFHKIYRKGEHKNIGELVEKYSHFDLESLPETKKYVNGIAGRETYFGDLYDKVYNAGRDVGEIDTCQIDPLLSMCDLVGEDVDDIDLTYPNDLKRIMHLFSIPAEQLVGNKCACDDKFWNCNQCPAKDFCNMCKQSVHNNLGNLISENERLSGGITVIRNEKGTYNFEKLYIPEEVILNDIVEYSPNLFCYYYWNDLPQNNRVNSYIDYDNPYTTVSRDTEPTEWTEVDGIMQRVLERILVQNLNK